MNIEAALGGERLGGTEKKCRLGRWLDEIPDNTPGKDQLTEVLSTTDRTSPWWRTLEELDAILRRLDLHSSNKTIGNHRMRRCRCYL